MKKQINFWLKAILLIWVGYNLLTGGKHIDEQLDVAKSTVENVTKNIIRSINK